MKGTCGHDHDTFESGLACKTARLLHDVSGGTACAALEMPRPNDCHHCAANWDNLARARAAFLVVEGSC